MSSSLLAAPVTPEQLERMPDGKRFELVDGQLVERQMGSESSWVAGEIQRLIANFVEGQKSGWVWPADAGYRCFSDDPNRVRRPDVSFVRRGRLPGERPSTGYETIAPDLVVEVISPNDQAADLDRKIDEYLKAGVALIWVVNPQTRTVTVYRRDGTTARCRNGDELTGDDVLPGFRSAVSAFFPPKQEAGGDGP
ncbi:MAG: Uma2 family endonuclease [Planctomycetaceae bacterium]